MVRREKKNAVINNIACRFIQTMATKEKLRSNRPCKAEALRMFKEVMQPVVRLKKLRPETIDLWTSRRDHMEDGPDVRGDIKRKTVPRKRLVMPINGRLKSRRKTKDVTSKKAQQMANSRLFLSPASSSANLLSPTDVEQSDRLRDGTYTFCDRTGDLQKGSSVTVTVSKSKQNCSARLRRKKRDEKRSSGKSQTFSKIYKFLRHYKHLQAKLTSKFAAQYEPGQNQSRGSKRRSRNSSTTATVIQPPPNHNSQSAGRSIPLHVETVKHCNRLSAVQSSGDIKSLGQLDRQIFRKAPGHVSPSNNLDTLVHCIPGAESERSPANVCLNSKSMPPLIQDSTNRDDVLCENLECLSIQSSPTSKLLKSEDSVQLQGELSKSSYCIHASDCNQNTNVKAATHHSCLKSVPQPAVVSPLKKKENGNQTAATGRPHFRFSQVIDKLCEDAYEFLDDVTTSDSSFHKNKQLSSVETSSGKSKTSGLNSDFDDDFSDDGRLQIDLDYDTNTGTTNKTQPKQISVASSGRVGSNVKNTTPTERIMSRAGESLLCTDDINKLSPVRNTERREDLAGLKTTLPALVHINELYHMPVGNGKPEEVDINKNRIYDGASKNLSSDNGDMMRLPIQEREIPNANADEERLKIVEVVSLADYIEQPNSDHGSQIPSTISGTNEEISGKTPLRLREEDAQNLSAKFDIFNIKTKQEHQPLQLGITGLSDTKESDKGKVNVNIMALVSSALPINNTCSTALQRSEFSSASLSYEMTGTVVQSHVPERIDIAPCIDQQTADNPREVQPCLPFVNGMPFTQPMQVSESKIMASTARMHGAPCARRSEISESSLKAPTQIAQQTNKLTTDDSVASLFASDIRDMRPDAQPKTNADMKVSEYASWSSNSTYIPAYGTDKASEDRQIGLVAVRESAIATTSASNVPVKTKNSKSCTKKRKTNKLEQSRYCQPVMQDVPGARPRRTAQGAVRPSKQTMVPAYTTSSCANATNVNASLRSESFHGLQQGSSVSVQEYCTVNSKCGYSPLIPNDTSQNRMVIKESPDGFCSNYHPEFPVTTALPFSQLGSEVPTAVATVQSSHVQSSHLPNIITHFHQFPVDQFGQPLQGGCATNFSASPALLPNAPLTTTVNRYSSTRLAPTVASEHSMRSLESFPYGITKQGPVKNPSQNGTAISVSCAKVADVSQTYEHFPQPPLHHMPGNQLFVNRNQNQVSTPVAYSAAPSFNARPPQNVHCNTVNFSQPSPVQINAPRWNIDNPVPYHNQQKLQQHQKQQHQKQQHQKQQHRQQRLRRPGVKKTGPSRALKKLKENKVSFPVDSGTVICSPMTLALITCYACNRKANFLCSGCRRVAYCSRKCQVNSWVEHRGNCIRLPVSVC